MAILGTPAKDSIINIFGVLGTIYRFAGNDSLVTGAYGGDELHGDAGNDTLFSGVNGNFDRLYGGADDLPFGEPADIATVATDWFVIG